MLCLPKVSISTKKSYDQVLGLLSNIDAHNCLKYVPPPRPSTVNG